MKKGLILLALTMVLASCSAREPNDEAYISAIGLDKGEESKYSVTIQFAIPEGISGGPGDKGKDETVKNISIDASDIYSAVDLANHMMSRRFSLSHMKLIVFSKGIAEEGIGSIMEGFMTSDEIRPNLLTAVSRGRANEYLENTKPVMEKNPTKYYHMIYESNNSTGIPAAPAVNVLSDLKSKDKDAVLPLAGEEGSGSGGQKPDTGFDHDNPDYKAVDVNIIEESRSEVLGMAVFSGDKLVCELGRKDADIYNILTGRYVNNFDSFPFGEENITLKLSETKKPVYDIDIINEEINISISLEGECSSQPETKIADRESLEQGISEEISRKCSELITGMRDEYNSDIVGIGKKVKRYCRDMKEYDSTDFDSRFRHYKVNVETKVKIKESAVVN